MSNVVHSIELLAPGSANDRIRHGVLTGIANPVGAAAGAAVAVPVVLPGLPANYAVLVSPGQDARWFISAKTANGFTVNLLPGVATATLAAGTFDVAILG